MPRVGGQTAVRHLTAVFALTGRSHPFSIPERSGHASNRRERHPFVVSGNPPDDIHGLEIPLPLIPSFQFLHNPVHPELCIHQIHDAINIPGIANTIYEPYVRAAFDSCALKLAVQVMEELKAALQARKDGDTKATKPADLWRRYNPSLRIASQSKRHGSLAAALIGDLYLEQTLSTGDLENPEYVDAYTKEKVYDSFKEWVENIPEQREPGIASLLHVLETMPDPDGDPIEGVASPEPVSAIQHELNRMAREAQQAMGWDEKTVQAFLHANRTSAGGEDEPEQYDDREFTPSSLEERELVIDRALFFRARPAVAAFNRRRSIIFDDMKGMEIHGKQEWWETWRKKITSRYEWNELIREIERVTNEDLMTGAALWLTAESDNDGYGVTPRDVGHITGELCGAANSEKGQSARILFGRFPLVGYALEWQDDLLDLVQDAGVTSKSLTSETDLDLFDRATERELKKTMPAVHPDPTRTQSWNLAYMEAIKANADIQTAENTAWAAWRLAMDEKAAKAYAACMRRPAAAVSPCASSGACATTSSRDRCSRSRRCKAT